MYGAYRGQTATYDENEALGILQHLDTEELQRLLDDDSKLNEYISDLQQVKNLDVDKETLMASNKSLAEYNLSQEPGLRQNREQLAEVYKKAVEIQKEFEKNKQKLDYTANQQSLDTTLALIQTEAAKAEEESETIAENFLDGNTEVEDFVDNYVSQRTIAHLRKVKSEKLAEILRNQQLQQHGAPSGAGGPAPWRSAPAPPVAKPWAGGQVPYPTSGYAMPDPTAYLPR